MKRGIGIVRGGRGGGVSGRMSTNGTRTCWAMKYHSQSIFGKNLRVDGDCRAAKLADTEVGSKRYIVELLR